MLSGNDSAARGLKLFARAELAGVVIQFLLGKAFALFADAPIAGESFMTFALLSLHVVLAIGQVAVAFLAVRPALHGGRRSGVLGTAGVFLVCLTFADGILLSRNRAAVWAYGMTAGSALLLPVYGMLYLRADRPSTPTKAHPSPH